jgi:diguanylate cyclase (GGDEF)-like protein
VNVADSFAKLGDVAGLARPRSHKVSVLQWIKLSVARQAGVIVAGSLSTMALAFWASGRAGMLPGFSIQVFLLGLLCFVPAAGLFAGWITQRLVGSRLAHLVDVIDGTGPHDDLARIRDLGADEVGAIANAVNRLLARITSIRASMIDQARQLGEAKRELVLKERLEQTTQELAQRLEERAMLFDIMRITSTSPRLDDVLRSLVERVGQMLRMREVVLFLYDDSLQSFAVQATHGFTRADALRGRTLRLGEGISGAVGKERQPLVIADVSKREDYLGFWGEAERSGSLAAVPIVYQDVLLGVMTVTRPEQEPVTDLALNLLCAIADNAALAIRNAQLFERMRQLSTHDELTGLPNQRNLLSHLERELDRARRFDKPMALLSLEIDHLQAALGGLEPGRAAAVLRDLALFLLDHVRKVDTVARVGEAQFVVLLPRCDGREGCGVAEKLRKGLAAHPFFDSAESAATKLTASVGVAQLSSADDVEGRSLLARAEQALAAARQAGRNRVQSAEPLPSADAARVERLS